MVAHSLGERVVGGSNPLIPTIFKGLTGFSVGLFFFLKQRPVLYQPASPIMALQILKSTLMIQHFLNCFKNKNAV